MYVLLLSAVLRFTLGSIGSSEQEFHLFKVSLKTLNYVPPYFKGVCLVTMDFVTASKLLQKPRMRQITDTFFVTENRVLAGTSNAVFLGLSSTTDVIKIIRNYAGYY